MNLFVTGMHRSGTSLVARLLTSSGIYSGGTADFHEPEKQDPNGYWEHKDFLEINERLLRESGASWCRPDQFDFSKIDPDKLEEITELAIRALNKLDGQTHWLVKDPRMSLTLKFWKKLLPDLCVLALYRDPLEVAQSLKSRDAFPIQYGIAIWEYYVRALLNNVEGSRVAFLSYEQLVNHPEKALMKVKRHINEWGFANLEETSIQESVSIIDKTLYRAKAKGLVESEYMTKEQQELRKLIDKGVVTPSGQSSPSRATTHLIKSFGTLISTHESQLELMNKVLSQREMEIENASKHSKSMEKSLRQKEQTIASLDLAIGHRNKELEDISLYVETLKDKANQAEIYSKSLENSLLENEQNTNLLNKTIHKQNEKITEISSYAKSLETLSDTSNARSKSIESVLKSRESQIDSLQTELLDTKSEIQEAKKYVSSLEQRCSELNTELNKANLAAQKNKSDTEKHIKALEAELSKIEAYAKSLEKEIEKLSLFIESQQKEANSFAEYSETLKQEMSNAAEYAKSLEQELLKVSDYAKTLEQELGKNK